jgi:hypothetical protein
MIDRPLRRLPATLLLVGQPPDVVVTVFHVPRGKPAAGSAPGLTR